VVGDFTLLRTTSKHHNTTIIHHVLVRGHHGTGKVEALGLFSHQGFELMMNSAEARCPRRVGADRQKAED
jgi:hypothetical protein